jgi:hypothetical protein
VAAGRQIALVVAVLEVLELQLEQAVVVVQPKALLA